MILRLVEKYAWLLWLVPALLLWAAFPPLAEKVDALFALAPLLWLVRRPGAMRRVVIIWFLNGFCFWLATLSWMPAIVKNGGPWPLVALGLVALSAYCALYFAAYGFLAKSMWDFVRGRSYWFRLFAVVVVEPVLWAGLEIVRSRFLGGFAWNQLGTVAVNAGFGAPAAFGGVYILSMVIVLINGTITGVAERIFRKGGTALETLLPLVIVYALYSFSGEDVAMRWKRYFNGEERKVALVQRNFPCVFDESAAENPDEVYSNLLANVSLLMPDLVVLPESAMAEFGRVNGANAHIFAENVRRQTGATEVIAGGTRVERGDNWLPKVYNSAALYTEDRTLFYDKVHLVPFGEFIPFDKTFPALQRFAPVGSCWPGELKLLGDYGVAICYEDTDSAQIRRLAEKGARALVFITNDSWFGGSHEAVQHAWQSTARAIETGLAVVRVGNSGVTGVIAPDGAATWLENSHSRPLTDMRGTMFDRIFLAPKDGKSALAPYVTLGDKPIFIVFSLFILAGFMIKYLKLIRKTKVEEDGIE